MPAPIQESELSFICVLGVSIMPLSMFVLLNFGTVPTVWYFCFPFYEYEKIISFILLDSLNYWTLLMYALFKK